MRIRVVDHYRWNRAKRIVRGWLCFGFFVVAIGFAGGLEGTEEAPSYFGAFIFLLLSWAAFPYNFSSTDNTEGAPR